MVENKVEMVNHPDHYKGKKFEVIDIIEDYNLNFNLGNAIKYILRCEKKHRKTQDLKKAIWYITREIENSKNNNTSFTVYTAMCQSCGLPFTSDGKELICSECKEKYVGE